MNLEKIKDTTKLEIPDFDGIGTIEVEVRRPKLIKMIEAGEIPNPLLGAAYEAVNGYKFEQKEDESKEEQANRFIKFANLYCFTCLVNPTFEEFDKYMTDDQRLAIASWAVTPFHKLRLFRDKQENSKNNTTVSKI